MSELSKTEAAEILCGMVHLKFFPTHQRAFDNLRDLLAKQCTAPQARWLVREVATTMDEYPGPATLLDMLAKRFPAKGTAYAEYDLGPKPAPITDAERAELDRGIAALAVKVGVPTPKPPRQAVIVPLERGITPADFDRLERSNA
ncbi:MAG TPA: hypothetical protein VN442_14250 [Bryobacteraceae bacterium]|nr:hypothetical protein [Bryobacteraceae bacterium]